MIFIFLYRRKKKAPGVESGSDSIQDAGSVTTDSGSESNQDATPVNTPRKPRKPKAPKTPEIILESDPESEVEVINNTA